VATEAKPFASLSSGLLARKGAARPAMRPQGFGQVGNGLEDLGWNDMGFEPPKPTDLPRDDSHDAFGDDVVEHPRGHPTGLTPVHSPVHTQQAEIAERFNGAEEDENEDEIDETAELCAAEPELERQPEPEPDDLELEPEPQPEPVVSKAVSPVVAKAVSPVVAKVGSPVVVPASAAPAPRRAPRPRSAAGSKGRAAFTLRLDPDRHLKLRLACAVDGRSAQQLVTDALDHLLERMPELDGLAAKAKRKG
jgi:hypothetical protein